MILHRAFPWDPGAAPGEAGGALFFPRAFQGAGRHDTPELYGCLYLAEGAVSAVAERLAPFRGSGPLQPAMLVQSGRPLALARLRLDDAASVIDLDDPAVLIREQLRPSRVATGRRDIAQADAAALWRSHPDAAGLRWWSTLEASWSNVTLFDRARSALDVEEVTALELRAAEARAAAEALGLFSS